MNKAIRFKLFLMMVLEFFIWGAWLPLIFGYLPGLGFTAGEQSLILNAFPIAAIVGSLGHDADALDVGPGEEAVLFHRGRWVVQSHQRTSAEVEPNRAAPGQKAFFARAS